MERVTEGNRLGRVKEGVGKEGVKKKGRKGIGKGR